MTNRIVTFLLLSVAFLAAACSECTARQIEDWPYDKLFKNAELVVIVKAASVRDATEKDRAVPPKGADYLTGVVTSFKVLQVVKGEYKEKELDLVHFKLKEGIMIGNGPLLVSFNTKPINLKGDFWSARAETEYLIFLKADKEKRLEFVSGQFDPALSVKQMTVPLP